MGFSPIREALNRLQADRLVMSAPLKGFSVAAISIKEMSDTINSRILIEAEALRLSMQRGDDNWEASVVSSLHALNLEADRAAKHKAGDPWRMESRHHAFHLALISACGSNWLLDFFERLYAESERYRHPFLASPVSSSTRDVRLEHSALSDATLARDETMAIRLLRDHYRQTEASIKALMEQQDLGAAQPAE